LLNDTIVEALGRLKRVFNVVAPAQLVFAEIKIECTHGGLLDCRDLRGYISN
jgi:hypothetical protein